MGTGRTPAKKETGFITKSLPVDQKKLQSFKHEAPFGRSPPPPGLHRASRGLHFCRRYWLRRMSKKLFLHLSSCKLCLHHHLYLHPRHHWHLLFGFPNDNEDVRGMLPSRSGNINSGDQPHDDNYKRNYCSFWIKKLCFYQCKLYRIHKIELNPTPVSSEI